MRLERRGWGHGVPSSYFAKTRLYPCWFPAWWDRHLPTPLALGQLAVVSE